MNERAIQDPGICGVSACWCVVRHTRMLVSVRPGMGDAGSLPLRPGPGRVGRVEGCGIWVLILD